MPAENAWRKRLPAVGDELRHPVLEEIERQERHEESDPEQQRVAAMLCREQLVQRGDDLVYTARLLACERGPRQCGDLRVTHSAEHAVQALESAGRLLAQQEVGGFGQQEVDERQAQHRERAAENEQRVPPPDRHHPRREEPRDRCAERVAALHQRHGEAPMPLRRQLRRKRGHRRHDAAEAAARDEAQNQQVPHRAREHYAEHPDRDQQ